MSGVVSFGGAEGEVLGLDEVLFNCGLSSCIVELEREGELSRIEGVGDWGGEEYECRWSTYAVDISVEDKGFKATSRISMMPGRTFYQKYG